MSYKNEIDIPVDTRRRLNVHKTFRRRPRRLLNALCTFNLRPVSMGKGLFKVIFKNTSANSLSVPNFKQLFSKVFKGNKCKYYSKAINLVTRRRICDVILNICWLPESMQDRPIYSNHLRFDVMWAIRITANTISKCIIK